MVSQTMFVAISLPLITQNNQSIITVVIILPEVKASKNTNLSAYSYISSRDFLKDLGFDSIHWRIMKSMATRPTQLTIVENGPIFYIS